MDFSLLAIEGNNFPNSSSYLVGSYQSISINTVQGPISSMYAQITLLIA